MCGRRWRVSGVDGNHQVSSFGFGFWALRLEARHLYFKPGTWWLQSIPTLTSQTMKGGKGGQGRTRSKTRVVEKTQPRGGTKKGAAKRDWGAISRDDDVPTTEPVEPPRGKPTGVPRKSK